MTTLPSVTKPYVFLCTTRDPATVNRTCQVMLQAETEDTLSTLAWHHFWTVHAAQVMGAQWPPIGHSRREVM